LKRAAWETIIYIWNIACYTDNQEKEKG